MKHSVDSDPGAADLVDDNVIFMHDQLAGIREPAGAI
jgi:hypothetical protein